MSYIEEWRNTNKFVHEWGGTDKFVGEWGIRRLIKNKFVKYYPDLFCHVYEDVTPIEPFPWKGKQGWSTVSEEVKGKIILLK